MKWGKYPANIYLLKVSNRNTRKRCEIFSKLTITTPGRRQWRRSVVFIVNFEHLFLMFSVVEFELVNLFWGMDNVRLYSDRIPDERECFK